MASAMQELELNPKDAMAKSFAALVDGKRDDGIERRKKRMSKPGKLKLPPLLEKRRREFFMPDEMFSQACLFDRIYVHQLNPIGQEGETFGGTGIVKTMRMQSALERGSNRGVIVSAGLKALDNLRSNGVDLGHIVQFIHAAPWKSVVGVLDNGQEMTLLVLRDGDLIASEDLGAMMSRGQVQPKNVGKGAALVHVLKTKGGKIYTPTQPWMNEY